MRRDDVKRALDALASEVPTPKRGASAVIARGRRRRAQRRAALVGVAAALVVAVAIGATIARTRNSPNAVSTRPTVSTPIADLPNGVFTSSSQFPSALEGWKCGNPMQYTDNGGQTWRKIALPAGVPAGGGECTAVPGGNAWMTWPNGNGGTWQILRIRKLTDMQIFSLPSIPQVPTTGLPTFIDTRHGWFGVAPDAGPMKLYRTLDGGATWTLAGTSSAIGQLAFANPEDGWARYGPTVYATSDAGTTWHKVAVPSPPAAKPSDIAYFQIAVRGNSIVVWGGTLITGSQYRTFFDVSNDRGQSWTLRHGPAGFELPAPTENFFGATDGTNWELTSGPELRVTDDGGRTWQTRPDLPLPKNATLVYPLEFPTPDTGWVTTGVGRILHTVDGGQSWTDVTRGAVTSSVVHVPDTTPPVPPTTPPTPIPIPLAVVSSQEAWLCGNPLWYSATGAATSPAFTSNWHTIDIASHPPALPNFQYPLCSAIPGGEAWVLTAAADPPGAQLIRIETGRAKKETLALPQLGSNATYAALTFADPTHGWALSAQTNSAPGERLYATTDGGDTWTLRNGQAPINVQAGQDRPLTFVSETEGWGLGSEGNLERTTDGGRTWHAVALPTPFVGVGAAKYVDTVVPTASGAIVAAGGQQTGTDTVPFFDVSTDGGNTWTTRSGPPGIIFGATVSRAFGAIDSDHWQFAYSNFLFLTSDGGRTWTQVAQFAGMAHATSVEFVTPEAGFVAGVAAPPDDSATYVLQTLDGGASWSTVVEQGPAVAPNPNVVGFPGGLIGCPTQPLTPVPPGNPPAGLVDAARSFLHLGESGPATIIAVHPVSQPTKDFGRLFGFQVGSCGAEAVADSWVVQLSVPSTDPAVTDDELQLALAHSADGWHVFGRY